jgi:hypothetical protein
MWLYNGGFDDSSSVRGEVGRKVAVRLARVSKINAANNAYMQHNALVPQKNYDIKTRYGSC